MDYIGVKTLRPDGKLTGELRIVGLFTSTAYTRSAATIPHPAPQGRNASSPRAGSRSGEPLRQGAGQRPGDLSARRTVPDRRRPALRVRRGDPGARASGRACVRWCRRDQFDRFVSVLVFVPRDRYDSDVRERIGAYLADGLRGPRVGLLPGFPGGDAADPRALHHRPRRRQDAVAAAGGARGGDRGDRPDLGGRAALPAGDCRRGRHELAERYADALSRGLSRRLSAARSRSPTSRSSSA